MRLVVLLVSGALLLTAAAASAANSGRTPRGHYVGRTSQGQQINVTVAASGTEFAGGRVYFSLHGGCRARRFLSLSPTPPPAVAITATGLTTFTGTFGPTSSFRYASKVIFAGQFSQRGRLLTGSGKYTAHLGHVSCTSGLIHFRATRR